MIKSRHLHKIVVVLLSLSLFVCALIVYFAQANPNTKTMRYESELFGDEILSIGIQVDEKDWQGLLADPAAKEYIPADLIINGETFSSVGLRTKGNSSLTQVIQMKDSDRYSIHFKFDQYQKGKTCYGLDTFCLNNVLGDNTYMKDCLSYAIMDYIGVPAPLTNYARVTVNGEDFGFFIVLERYEKSFLARSYDTTAGQLYNVKVQMGQPGGNPPNPMDNLDDKALEAPNNAEFPRGNFNPDNIEEDRPPQGEQNRGAGEFPQGRGGGFPGGMAGGRGGGDLVYADDSISSYSSIFDNAEFKRNSDQDKQRVIKAIKNLNEGTNLEKYFDVDEILRYLAAHTVVVNLDSYSSSMAQNYYIYEREGKVSILPWDYGLSFGGFQGGSADNTINFPIDTPVSGVSMEERPLISKLLEVPEYREKYHEYLKQIVEGYFKSGTFEETIRALDVKINDYVKNDTTSFTTYEEYVASLPILKELGALRAQSIEGQLNGAIPSTTEGQAANRDSLISGDGISLSALGSFMGGGRNGNPGGQGWPGAPDGQGFPGVPDAPDGQEGWGGLGGLPGEMPDLSMMREAMSVLQESGGQINDEASEKLLALGLDEQQIKQMADMFDNFPGGDLEKRDNRGNFPGRAVPQGQERAASRQGGGSAENTAEPAYIILIGLLLLIVAAATLLLSRFKKRY